MDLLLRGVGDEQDLGRQQRKAAAKRAGLKAEPETMAEPPNTVALHPEVLKRYEEQLIELAGALRDGEAVG